MSTAGQTGLHRKAAPMDTIRFFTSGALFLFAVYSLIWNPQLPFSLPVWLYAAVAVYFAVFPLRDCFPS